MTGLLCLILWLGLACCHASAVHGNNWAVIVDTSRYWYNYRHAANALSFYRALRRLGFPDDRIILMLADDAPCSPRNPFPGTIFNDRSAGENLYGDAIEVDFRSDEVTVDSFIRLLTGRQSPWTPYRKRLLSDASSNVLIYMTGHGGNRFLKFRDWEEIGSRDIADAVKQMWAQKRYNRLFFLSETCQASTLQADFASPRVLAAGCSKINQNSYSHHSDDTIGVAVIDRFTYFALDYMRYLAPTSNNSLQEFFDFFKPSKLLSDMEVRTDLFDLDLKTTPLVDFIASSAKVKFIEEPFEMGWAVRVKESDGGGDQWPAEPSFFDELHRPTHAHAPREAFSPSPFSVALKRAVLMVTGVAL